MPSEDQGGRFDAPDRHVLSSVRTVPPGTPQGTNLVAMRVGSRLTFARSVTGLPYTPSVIPLGCRAWITRSRSGERFAEGLRGSAFNASFNKMIPHRRLLEITRDTKSTLYVVAVFYILIGFALATWGLAAADRLGTFVGFVIISGALATTTLLRAVLRMGVQLSSIYESLECLRTELTRRSALPAAPPPSTPGAPRVGNIVQGATDGATSALDAPAPSTPAPLSASTEADSTTAIDLSYAPLENAEFLTAVTLERGVFPRLVRAMESDPPAQSVDDRTSADAMEEEPVPIDALEWFDGPLEETGSVRAAAAIRNILRSWKVALRERDLPVCRRILAALEDTADPSVLEPLRGPFQDLVNSTERDLRNGFTHCRLAGDVVGMLRIGRTICALLPERPVAEEFRRIEPHLARRASALGEADELDAARAAR